VDRQGIGSADGIAFPAPIRHRANYQEPVATVAASDSRVTPPFSSCIAKVGACFARRFPYQAIANLDQIRVDPLGKETVEQFVRQSRIRIIAKVARVTKALRSGASSSRRRDSVLMVPPSHVYSFRKI